MLSIALVSWAAGAAALGAGGGAAETADATKARLLSAFGDPTILPGAASTNSTCVDGAAEGRQTDKSGPIRHGLLPLPTEAPARSSRACMPA